MRIGEYTKIGTRLVTRQVWIPPVETIGDSGVIVESEGHFEGVEEEAPVMGMVYRDMTPEEEAQIEAETAAYEANREPTPEEQLRADVDFIMAMEGWL